MPGLLANDTQLQLPLVQFLDILYISATKPEDLTFLQQSQKVLHFCNKARRSYISATKPEDLTFPQQSQKVMGLIPGTVNGAVDEISSPVKFQC